MKTNLDNQKMRPPKYWCQLASAALTCLIVLSTPNGQAAVQAPPGIGLPELDTQSIQAPPPIEESSNSAVSKAAAMMGDSPLTPVPELTNERFSQVDAGGSSVCGILKGSAEIKCWGIDDLGQASPPEGQYKFISMGANHGCALTKAKGLMRCWGAQSAFPHPEQASGRYLSIAAGDDHTCARKLDQTVECWGNNEHGELEVPTGKYRQIVARGDHTCGVTESRGLLCWGDKAFTEYPNNISYPVKRVATGKLHGCVLRGDTMRAECWGNASGGMTNPPPERFIDLVAGDWHTCGVRPNRTAVCWGENEYGQLNIPNKRFKKLSAGGVMTCGILEKSSQTTCAGSFAADSLFFPDDQLAVSKAYQQDGVVRPQLAFMVVFEGIAGLLSSTLINGGKFADKKGKDWESKMIPLQMGILLVNLAMKWIFGGGGVDQTKLLLQDIQKGVDRLESGMKHITQQLANQSYLIQATYCDQQLISYEGAVAEIKQAQEKYEILIQKEKQAITRVTGEKDPQKVLIAAKEQEHQLKLEVRKFRDAENGGEDWAKRLENARIKLQTAILPDLVTSPLTACLGKGHAEWAAKVQQGSVKYPFDDRPIYANAYKVLRQALLRQGELMLMQQEIQFSEISEAMVGEIKDASGALVTPIAFNPDEAQGICSTATEKLQQTQTPPLSMGEKLRWENVENKCIELRTAIKRNYISLVKQVEHLGGAYSDDTVVLSMTSKQMGLVQPQNNQVIDPFNLVKDESNWLWLRKIPDTALKGNRRAFQPLDTEAAFKNSILEGGIEVFPGSAKYYFTNAGVYGSSVWHSNGQAWKDLYSIRAKDRSKLNKDSKTGEDILADGMEGMPNELSKTSAVDILIDVKPSSKDKPVEKLPKGTVCTDRVEEKKGNATEVRCKSIMSSQFSGVTGKTFWMSERKDGGKPDFIYDARYKAEGGGQDLNYDYYNKFGMYCFVRSGANAERYVGYDGNWYQHDNWYHPGIDPSKRQSLGLQGKICAPEELAAGLTYEIQLNGNVLNRWDRQKYLPGFFEVRQRFEGLGSYYWYSIYTWVGTSDIWFPPSQLSENNTDSRFNTVDNPESFFHHMPVVRIDSSRGCNTSMAYPFAKRASTRTAGTVEIPSICGNDLDDTIRQLIPRPEYPTIPESEVRQ